MDRLEKLLKSLSEVKIEDIASVPKKEQPALVDHLEELQDQLRAILKDSKKPKQQQRQFTNPIQR